MTDRATPNLPSRDFDVTERFYCALGFERRWRDAGWLVLGRGGLQIEFFPHPDLHPTESWFSCCLRLGDLDAFARRCLAAGVPTGSAAVPRYQAAQGYGDALIDPDGSLLRLIQN